MNQRVVKQMLPVALAVLEDPGLNMVKMGEMSKLFRGHVSTMGATMVMSSFKAAVVFYADESEKNNRDIFRKDVLRAVHAVATATFTENGFCYQLKQPKEIVEEVLSVGDASINQFKERYINASIALKQAMNAFTLV